MSLNNCPYKNPCEYNPYEKRAAYYSEVHAAAEWVVGYKGKWRLCDSCANLSEFKRFRVRTRIKRGEK